MDFTTTDLEPLTVEKKVVCANGEGVFATLGWLARSATDERCHRKEREKKAFHLCDLDYFVAGNDQRSLRRTAGFPFASNSIGSQTQRESERFHCFHLSNIAMYVSFIP